MSTFTVGFQVFEQAVNRKGQRMPKAITRVYHVRSAAEEHCRMLHEQADRDRNGETYPGVARGLPGLPGETAVIFVHPEGSTCNGAFEDAGVGMPVEKLKQG